MPYMIAHKWASKEWVVKNEDGTYSWGPYEKAEKFQNWFKAEAAYKTMEPIRDMYNYVVKPHYMKVS